MDQLSPPATVHFLHQRASGLSLIKLFMVGMMFTLILVVLGFSAMTELFQPHPRASRLEHQSEI